MDIKYSGFERSYTVEFEVNAINAQKILFVQESEHMDKEASIRFSLVVDCLDGNKWIGLFGRGVKGGISGIYDTPSKDTVCVISEGLGFWIPVNSPESFTRIKVFPIKEVVSMPSQGIILFIDFDQIACFDVSGLRWLTHRISWDGIVINEVNSSSIKGMTWNAPTNENLPFEIHLENGEVKGGSNPDI